MPLEADKVRIATIQEMIAELDRYREIERDRDMRENYRAAIDRLDALVYRLTEREPPRVIRPRRSPLAAEQLVGAIVRARKPKWR
jgi:hypothetical protein